MGRPVKPWGQLSASSQQRYARRGRELSPQGWGPTLTGRQAHAWESLSPSYRRDISYWSHHRGLSPAQVWATGQRGYAGANLLQAARRKAPADFVDPLTVVRKPWRYPGWLSEHKALGQQVARSDAGHKAFDAQIPEADDPIPWRTIAYGSHVTTYLPAASLIPLSEQGIGDGHVRAGHTYINVTSVLDYIGGLFEAGISGIVFALATFDADEPWVLWWRDSP